MLVSSVFRKIAIAFDLIGFVKTGRFFLNLGARCGDDFSKIDYACSLIKSDSQRDQTSAVTIFKQLVGTKNLRGLPEANLAFAYQNGIGVIEDQAKSDTYVRQALDLGFDEDVLYHQCDDADR